MLKRIPLEADNDALADSEADASDADNELLAEETIDSDTDKEPLNDLQMLTSLRPTTSYLLMLERTILRLITMRHGSRRL